MNQKKSTTLYGSLMSPLTVGHCALIRYQGQLMRTSKVVAIHSRSADIPELCGRHRERVYADYHGGQYCGKPRYHSL